MLGSFCLHCSWGCITGQQFPFSPTKGISLKDLLWDSLGAWRLAHLIASERGPFDLARRIRAWVRLVMPRDHWLVAGLHCQWCLSFWFGVGIVWLPKPIRQGLGVAGSCLLGMKLADFIQGQRHANP